jgi:uncharacterized protein (DUF342 family)
VATKTEQRVLVTVDADHMRAWLRLAPEVEAADLAPGEIAAALKAAKVVTDDSVIARIEESIKQAPKEGPEPEPSLVAEGTLPTEGEHGRFVWDESIDKAKADGTGADDEGRIDHRMVNMVRTVEAGQAFGKIVPPVAGKSGLDVQGSALKPKTRVEPIKLQANVRLGDDGQTVIAEKAGCVVLDGLKLSICEVLEIAGDVDFQSGNVDATSDVAIRGTVRDMFEVVSKKGITIGGAVEAAKVEAERDVVVHGGIVARSKGVVRAGGGISAKFCVEAYLRAEGGIEIGKEAINSHLHTMGKLQSKRAAIIGGQVYAREGVDVHTIGSDACVPTRIYVGIDPGVLKRARELDEQLKLKEASLGKIRAKVQPLLAEVKRLAPAQKEQAAKLIHQADQIKQSIAARRAEQEEMLVAYRPESPPTIEVQSRICPNAVLVIDDLEVHFQKDLKGPVRIEKRIIKNVTKLVAVNTSGGPFIRLASRQIDLGAIPDEDEDRFERAKASSRQSSERG